ncbi:MAG: methyltransferase domain-containing protein [Spirochaetia bacterium]|nr:methyltransferase domain-containing protein [Spirochaetia bacterium]
MAWMFYDPGKHRGLKAPAIPNHPRSMLEPRGKMILLLMTLSLAAAFVYSLHWLSYRLLKTRIVSRQKWGLNICSGNTDGGGVNADIVSYGNLPKFIQLGDIYRLPFRNLEFDSALCSHTMEHVEDPDKFYRELSRVAREVTLVLPPLWDLPAVLNIWEHRWIFLTFKKEHRRLPPRIRLPFSWTFQRIIGQRIKA